MKKHLEPEPSFEWDIVTWSLLVIVIAIGVLILMSVWPLHHPFPIREP